MFTKSYRQAITLVGEISPTLDKPSEFIKWAEDIAQILSHIYSEDYDTVTEDIVKAAKENQDWEDE